MKECPYCGMGFNWWQRAIGEYKEHLRSDCKLKAQKGAVAMSTGCRGCPAGCFEGDDHKDNA